MKKELSFKHQLICGMSMKLLMFLIKEKALSSFVDNIIKHRLNDIKTVIENANLIKIDNTFYWSSDKSIYTVDGKKINAVNYWRVINDKYEEGC